MVCSILGYCELKVMVSLTDGELLKFIALVDEINFYKMIDDRKSKKDYRILYVLANKMIIIVHVIGKCYQ